MTRAEGLAIVNARRSLLHASVYLLVRSNASAGREPWVLDALNLRETLLVLIERHHDLFERARRATMVDD